MSYSRDDTSTIARRQLPACSIGHAREAAIEALAELAATYGKLECGEQPVLDDVRLKPDYWVGVLQGVLLSLLVTLEEPSVPVCAS